ncbi:uncharacterized protein CC84DRAFT_62514 [Paraphaeosphaeria sporulosa]|uniref:Uncharacterized protein n=1 Tax=Paraphaeosphaeria sporulosa TaxID=1460663 RepID=A0A177CYK3_9PLEO|nr:uncharacterized protein CC84DRAFT_62514 [Paraphaeosphaeria sporulosa]OAG11947.1 hypothetical protein CC84DRAFT_62514 [Paraphaeosphaeria sporulosa]
MTRPKVPPEQRQRTAQACESCKRRKQKVRLLLKSHIGLISEQFPSCRLLPTPLPATVLCKPTVVQAAPLLYCLCLAHSAPGNHLPPMARSSCSTCCLRLLLDPSPPPPVRVVTADHNASYPPSLYDSLNPSLFTVTWDGIAAIPLALSFRTLLR